MPHPQPSAVIKIVAWVFVGLLALCVVAVAATGVLLPRCGLCHSSGAFGSATQASAHGKVQCSDCHVGKSPVEQATFAFQQVGHVTAVVFKAAASGASDVPDERCLACHTEVQQKVVGANGLRIKHLTCAKGSRCTDCHSETAHGSQTKWPRAYDMDQCLHCHGSDPKLSKCDLCHQGRRTEERLTSGPWTVTHGPNWRQTHGMGDQFTCSACHPKGFCDKCHGPGLPHKPDFRLTHPTVATNPAAKCTMCHKTTFCTDCHGLQMPHPVAFIKTHSDTVKSLGTGVCERCHAKADCITCHVLHVHPGGAVPPKPVPKVVQ